MIDIFSRRDIALMAPTRTMSELLSHLVRLIRQTYFDDNRLTETLQVNTTRTNERTENEHSPSQVIKCIRNTTRLPTVWSMILPWSKFPKLTWESTETPSARSVFPQCQEAPWIMWEEPPPMAGAGRLFFSGTFSGNSQNITFASYLIFISSILMTLTGEKASR